MSKKDKLRSPKFYEGIEDPEMFDWEEDTADDMRFDTGEQRCFPFPAVVIAASTAAGCNPRFCRPHCNPNCNPRFCNPNCNPNCNPRFCNPNSVCNPRAGCNPNTCRPFCFPVGSIGVGYCRPHFTR